MPAWLNIIVQVLLGGIQLYNKLSEYIPEDWKVVALVVVTAAQIILARIAQNYNPNGTKSEVPYISPNEGLKKALLG